MSSFPKYYPLLSDLTDSRSIPGDFESLEGITNVGIKFLLGNLRYRDFLIEKSPDGDTAFYSLTILGKELKLPLFGLGIDLVFFAGAENGFIQFPIGIDWRLPIKRYLSGFENQGFSHAPEAFVDILLELSEIKDEQEFVESIVGVFLSDGTKAYLNFYTNFRTTITQIKTDYPFVSTSVDNILAQIDKAKAEIDTRTVDPDVSLIDIAKDYKNNTVFTAAVDSAKTSFEEISDAVDVDIDPFKTFIETALKDIADLDQKFGQLIDLFRTWLGNVTWDDIEYLLIPQFSMELSNINMALEFPRKWIRPLGKNGEVLDENTETSEEQKQKSKLTFNVGSLKYSTQTGFHFLEENSFDFDKSMIGKTGLTIDFTEMKLDLSRTTNIQEAIADGRPEDFMGVYAEQAEIGLPEKWFKQDNNTTLAIIGRNLLIGTGGISGTIGLEVIGAPGEPLPADPEMIFTLGKKQTTGDRKGFKIIFNHFHMIWQQNSLIESSVKGGLTLPKFQQCIQQTDGAWKAENSELTIDIEALFEEDGDFQITAKPDGGLSFCLDNAFIVSIDGLEVGKNDDTVFLCISGSLLFDNNKILKELIKDPIEVKSLCVYSDGSFEIEGGSIPLPDSAKLKLGPTEVYITNLTFGAEEREHGGVLRKYKYFGFDCGVNAGTIGLDLRGDGIAYYFTVDNDDNKPSHSFLKIAGIGIDLVIPGNASKESATILIQGYLSLKEQEYLGSINFQIPKAQIAGGASMAMKPKVPAWVVDAHLELALPIPLGPSGLGIYGFRGLFGYRYIAAKEAAGLTQDDQWFDYYKIDKAPRGKGVHVGKMYTPEKKPTVVKQSSNPVSIGAGLSLATQGDDGKAFSLQAFFLISLPELIFIEGKANVLGDRVGIIEGEPPFFAFVAFSPGHSVEFGFGADYKQREDGHLIDLHAEVQAGFFMQNSSAWYVNFGTKDKPVTAQILSLFNSYSYLMLSASGIEAGSGVTFGFDKKYGPLKVSVGVYLDIWGTLSFEGAQIGAGIALGGHVNATVWRIGFYISIATILEATVPRPFRIAGSVEVCVSVKVLFKKFKKCVDVDFIWLRDKSFDKQPISPLLEGPPGGTTNDPSPVSAFHIGSGKTYTIDYLGARSSEPGADDITAIVPLDSYIDIQFNKAVDPNAVSSEIGGVTNPPSGHMDLIPPKPSYNRVTHVYTIKAVSVKVFSGGNWVDYHPYEALTAGSIDVSAGINLADLKLGFFQKIGREYNKIRFLAQTPFSYMETSAGGYIPEQMGVTSSTLFCEGTKRQWQCASWSDLTSYFSNQWYYREALTFIVRDKNGVVVDFKNVFQIPRSLMIPNEATLEITLPKASVSTKLKLFSFSSAINIRYFQSVRVNDLLEYNEVHHVKKSSAEFLQAVLYEDATTPIERIIIEPARPDPIAWHQLELAVDKSQQRVYEGGNKRTSNNQLQNQLDKNIQQLDELRSIACNLHPKDDDSIKIIIAELEKCKDQLQICHEEEDSLQDQFDTVCRNCKALESTINKCLNKIKPASDQLDIIECLKQIRLALRKQKSLTRVLSRLITQLVAQIEECNTTISAQLQELYAQLLDKIVKCHRECKTLEQQLEDKRNECAALEDKIKKLEALLEQGGGYIPPDGSGYCGTYIHEICWLTEEDYSYNQTIPAQDAINEDYQLAQAAIENIISPIWRPMEKYLVHVQVSDTVNGTEKGIKDIYFGFKTQGPVGHFDENQVADIEKFRNGPETEPDDNDNHYDQKVEVPETTLKFYIDNDKSYPDPTGNIINRKPLYYKNPRLLLFYTKPYVYHFFGNWDAYQGLPARSGRLGMVIKDPVEDISDLTSTDHTAAVFTLFPQTTVSWNVDDDPIVPEDVQVYGAIRNPEINNPDYQGAHCWISGGDPIVPASKSTEIIPKHLKPLKLYTAIVNNVFEDKSKEVHRYGFQTSRFGSHEEHIDSYHLKDKDGNTRDAVFQLEVDLDINGVTPQVNINRAFELVENNLNSLSNYNKKLAELYSDPFQRLIEGHFKLKAMHPPVGLEFNFIYVGNIIIGIFIHSREPLNDPKIPFDDLRNSIKVLENENIRYDYYPLFSKDCTKVFLMNSNKKINALDVRVRFSYLEWNGKQYNEQSSSTTDNLVIV